METQHEVSQFFPKPLPNIVVTDEQNNLTIFDRNAGTVQRPCCSHVAKGVAERLCKVCNVGQPMGLLQTKKRERDENEENNHEDGSNIATKMPKTDGGANPHREVTGFNNINVKDSKVTKKCLDSVDMCDKVSTPTDLTTSGTAPQTVDSNADVTVVDALNKIQDPKLGETEKVVKEDGNTRMMKALAKLNEMMEYSNRGCKDLIKSIGDCYWDYPDEREELADLFRERNGAALCVKMINNLSRQGLFKTNGAWFTAYYVYTLCWNFSDVSLALCKSYGENGMIRICLTNVAHQPYQLNLKQKNIMYLVKSSLNILHNMAKEPSIRHYFRQEKAVDKIKYYTQCDAYLKALAMMTLAYIIEEHENHVITDQASNGGDEPDAVRIGKGAIEFIAKLLRDALCSPTGRAEGFSSMELAQGLGHLAVNDSNKTKIDAAGALPLLVEMLKRVEPLEQVAAANALWNLTFDDTVRMKIKDNGDCILALQQLSRTGSDKVKTAANGALWVIGRDDRPPTRRYNSRSGKFIQPHVMISYQWGSQETVLKIATDLKEAGYNVWIDVEYMGGSTLEAMAEAVEHAAVVLVCAAQKYKESPNCRTEAEYTYQLHKDVVPLLMESYYKPDGWLGMLMGVKLYIDFSGVYTYEDQIKKLIKELGERGKKVMSMEEGNLHMARVS
ncbi:uncharacterized protein LOC102806025 [Saccoglossus kowalevskii]